MGKATLLRFKIHSTCVVVLMVNLV
jgi:hypothetical protein